MCSMEYTLDQIENWCTLRKFPKEQIEEVKKNFIKQSLFNKIVNRTDETNRNFGLIVSKGNVCLAPGYDYDHSFDTVKKQTVNRTVGNNDSSIEGFVEYYSKYDWFKNWIPKVISNIDIEQAIDEENLSDIAYIYRNRIQGNIKKLEEAYMHIGSDVRDDSEINVER